MTALSISQFQLEIFSHNTIESITTTSLAIKEGTEITPWLDLTENLFQLKQRLSELGGRETIWSIADALNFGEANWTEEYAQALDPNQCSPKTAGNWMRVAKKFISSRRREKLSFSHHAAVYNLPELDQDKMLDEAEREGYSVGQLRKRVREEYPTEKSARAAAKRKENGVGEDGIIAMDDTTAISHLRDVLFYLETTHESAPSGQFAEDLKGVLAGYKKIIAKLNKG